MQRLKFLKQVLLGATVVLNAPCGYLTPTGEQALTMQSHITITDFTDGTAVVTCRAQVDPPGQRVVWEYANTGILVGCGFGPTTQWQEVIAPSGQVTLECRARRR